MTGQNSTTGPMPSWAEPTAPIPFDNLRGLVQDLVVELDVRLTSFRQGTRYAHVRPFDVKVFIMASRQPRPMAQIARELGVSRQAVHSSLRRMADLKVLELVPEPGNGRQKLVALTQRGAHARQVALHQIHALEEECAAIIGDEALQQLRAVLVPLVKGLKQRRTAPQATGVKS